MSDLGIISQQALAIKNTQLSLIKSANDMQQKVVEILEEARESIVGCKGQNVDRCL